MLTGLGWARAGAPDPAGGRPGVPLGHLSQSVAGPDLAGFGRFGGLRGGHRPRAGLVFFFLKRATTPASTGDPKKVKKLDFDFCQFFLHFLAPPARCGSNEYHVHRSELNIYRVMTRNESAVFKEESTLPIWGYGGGYRTRGGVPAVATDRRAPRSIRARGRSEDRVECWVRTTYRRLYGNPMVRRTML